MAKQWRNTEFERTKVMMNRSTIILHTRALRAFRAAAALLLCAAIGTVVGCHSTKTEKKKDEFFTSGSRQADQRASQRMAKEEQLAGTGEGSGEKGAKKAKPAEEGGKPAQAENKMTLYDRLGGEQHLTAIVDDFTARVLEDPRVNWSRKGVKSSGFSFRKKSSGSAMWNPTPENVATIKKHLVQFLSLATGGPAKYEGKEMKPVHSRMHISNPEFDAAVGDLKASLDKQQLPNKEQKELLAIIESTRPQIVTER